MRAEAVNEARPRLLRETWERAAQGPVALVNCWEEIPCDPCREACREGAIELRGDMNSPPVLRLDRCNGCGKCVSICPGMAIVIVDRSVGAGNARVSVPYEMREDIKAGGEAWVTGEQGECLVKGRVISVRGKRRAGQTMLVTVEVPEECALKVRGVRGRRKVLEEPEESVDFRPADDFILCRCEEIDNSRMREIIEKGHFKSLPALRRASRAGLGFCQGRFCQSMLREQFLRQGDAEPDSVFFKVRAPVRPISLKRLGGEDE